jgi:SAM-dependent methyltransferase
VAAQLAPAAAALSAAAKVLAAVAAAAPKCKASELAHSEEPGLLEPRLFLWAKLAQVTLCKTPFLPLFTQHRRSGILESSCILAAFATIVANALVRSALGKGGRTLMSAQQRNALVQRFNELKGGLSRAIDAQTRKPTGLLGRLVGSTMVRMNEPAARWTVSLLDLQPESHVLEVGFGPGVAIQYASEKASEGFVAGIDYSETMVQTARKRNAAAIRAGRVDLKHGDVSDLPYPDESFDKAFAIHSILFWPKPVDCLKELRRVLKPNGLLAITIVPKGRRPDLPPELGTVYDSDEVAAMLSDAGFRDVRVETSSEQVKFRPDCVLGVKK